ncbi:CoA-binding protein [Halomarina litorea]|uniref:CoA-binding protein n=1 Tax=Halomarina litorea TaxID=2961595 RepID=UPI0020C3015C|nr:CoA-binding protein [Halomarina sp. BCD28]
MPVESDEELREALGGRRVAVVGASTTEGKAAHEIPKYLVEHGYDVVLVNPYADEMFDRDGVAMVWHQLGITNDGTGKRVEESGRKFVQDHCMKVEHDRLLG